MCFAAFNTKVGCGAPGLVAAVALCVLVSCPLAAVADNGRTTNAGDQMSAWGVCPPFHLRDEQGNVINPVTGENAEKPYSPKQTCGQSDGV